MTRSDIKEKAIAYLYGLDIVIDIAELTDLGLTYE